MISIPYFILIASFRFVLYVLGWFGLPLLFKPFYGDPKYIAAKAQTSLWKTYKEMAWRNPTNGMKGWFQQPIPEKKPNPDAYVRGNPFAKYSAHRWMKKGVYWEYWYLTQKKWGKRRYFEFRIGWKFVDGNDEFFPTFQLGPRT